MTVEDKVLVRGVSEHTGGEGHGGFAGFGEIASRTVAQHFFIPFRRFPVESIRLDYLLEVLVEPDFETRDVIDRKAVVPFFRHMQVKDRKILGVNSSGR